MATAHDNPTTSTTPSRHPDPLGRAWLALALIPLAFIAAFAIGESLYAALGYTPEDATEPVWVALAAGIPAIVVFLIPCCAAMFYGHRARVEGRRAGLVPMIVGGVVGGWMVVMNVVSLLA